MVQFYYECMILLALIGIAPLVLLISFQAITLEIVNSVGRSTLTACDIYSIAHFWTLPSISVSYHSAER